MQNSEGALASVPILFQITSRWDALVASQSYLSQERRNLFGFDRRLRISGGWLERLEPVLIALLPFYVGWVLAARQLSPLWLSTVLRTAGSHWGLWALGPPLLGGALLSPSLASPLLHLAQALTLRVSLGSWALLAGWSLAQPLAHFPWLIALHLAPLIIGLHVPLALTTTRWPRQQQGFLKKLGWLCFCLASLSALGLVLAGYVFPQKFWPRMLPFVVGLPVLYRIWCFADNPQRVRRGLVFIVALLSLVVGWLLLTCVGVT